MKIQFTKMHGCGNDYVYINGFTQKVPQEQKVDFVRKISDRHFGIGSDGAIFINPAKEADFEMEMYNADGSRSEMCGNGMRCVGKYVYDYGLTNQKEFSVVSAGKIKYLTLFFFFGCRKKVKRFRPNRHFQLLTIFSRNTLQAIAHALMTGCIFCFLQIFHR